MIIIDGFYFTVSDLAKSIAFYEKLLGIKPSHLEGERWADFYVGERFFGLLCDKNNDRQIGNNGVLNLRTDDLLKDFERVKAMGIEIVYEPCDTPDSPYEYFSFAVVDPDGNFIEIAQEYD